MEQPTYLGVGGVEAGKDGAASTVSSARMLASRSSALTPSSSCKGNYLVYVALCFDLNNLTKAISSKNPNGAFLEAEVVEDG